jgi:hypothetical protein
LLKVVWYYRPEEALGGRKVNNWKMEMEMKMELQNGK